MSRLFDSRVGLPLAAMVPLGLLGCEAYSGNRPYETRYPSSYYYDNFFNRSGMSSERWRGGSWDSQSVEDHVLEKYRR